MKFRATRGRTCRVCGCTDDNACEGGCYWLNGRDDLCSACIAAQKHVVHMTSDYGPKRTRRKSILPHRPISVATCEACGWQSRMPKQHHRKQDAAVRTHWRNVVALAGGTHV